MRSVALVLIQLLITAPPAESSSSAGEANGGPIETGDNSPECDLDRMLAGECEFDYTPPETTPSHEPDPATAQNLKVEARGLAAQGKLGEAIIIYERAYQLAPEDHILAYEIGVTARKLKDCGTAEQYLTHFLLHSDPSQFANKQRKAVDVLNAGCTTAAEEERANEISEAVSAAAGPRSKHPGDAAMGIGATLAALGGVAVVAGIVLVALSGASSVPGPMCTIGKPCGDSCISIDKMCHIGGTLASGDFKPGFALGGGIMIPVGTVTLVGGVILFVTGSSRARQSRLTVAPTGVVLHF